MGSHKLAFEALNKQQIKLFDDQINLVLNTIAKNKKIGSDIVEKFQKLIEKGLKDLQQQEPTLRTRLTEDYASAHKQAQNNEWPLQKDLDFNNYLFAVQAQNNTYFIEFVLSNNQKSNQTGGSANSIPQVSLNSKVIKKIQINYHSSNGMVYGLSFFDKNGNNILEAGVPNAGLPNKDIRLGDNERIIGFKSRCNVQTGWYIYDLQFVIGKLE